jgi:hypothetical protein
MTRFRLAAIYLLAIATGLLVGYAIEYGGGNAGIWAGAILTTLIAAAEWSTHRRLLSIAIVCLVGSGSAFIAGLPLLALPTCAVGQVLRCAPPGSQDRTLGAAGLVVAAGLVITIFVLARVWSGMRVRDDRPPPTTMRS